MPKPIASTVEIDRPPDLVFAYATDPSRFGEWQRGVVDGHLEGPTPPVVGTICKMT
ncbi:MAG: SRPBCC family protein, partial [Acidimicrobiales bacterium]